MLGTSITILARLLRLLLLEPGLRPPAAAVRTRRGGIPNNVVDDSLVYIGSSDLVLAATESIQQAAHRNRRQTSSNLSAVLFKKC
ncbi:Deoxyguanosinetriphosphate triphosphohydrolase-like protein [Frankliniella fusca]|uniref:Deoxyguanosinetriphosphate triphosphohydrolase-like protein n=1 Tax=Frankliniella fusca TaxID=407009 RepID=A0AAE1H8I1_9NEOP|nr:Deoxyguanosinetriphosphate triphosphohydrolase-like protein [Frankliniella fusca]